MTKSPPPARPGLFSSMGLASTMGLHMVSGVLVGGGVGYALDKWLDTQHWFAAIFLIIGIFAGFRNVWIDARRLMREGADRERTGSPRP